MPCNVTKPAWVLNRDNLMNNIYTQHYTTIFVSDDERNFIEQGTREAATQQITHKKIHFEVNEIKIPVLVSKTHKCVIFFFFGLVVVVVFVTSFD